MQLATRQSRLQHVASVHRTLCLAGTHHGVDFIDEQNGLPLVFGQLVQHRLQPLFKLTAKFRTGQQRRHVQGQHTFAFERIGHFTGDDALRQAFHNGGFADTGLANQDRVVFATALQHLDGAANFIISANHRIELAGAGSLGQIHAVFFQGFALAFGICGIHFVATAQCLHRRGQALAGQAVLFGFLRQVCFRVTQGQQKQFAGDELVAALHGVFFSGLHQGNEVAPHLHLLLALHLGQLVHGLFGVFEQTRDVHASTQQKRTGSIVLAQQGHQQMAGFDVSMVCTQGQCLGLGQGFLKLSG